MLIKKQVILWTIVLVVLLAPVMGFCSDQESAEDISFNPNPTQRLIIPVKDQSEEQQLADQWECFDWTSEQIGWDPYQGYAELTDAGYAVALTPEQLEEGLICLAIDGAVKGAVAGEILNEHGEGAEIGAAISISIGLIQSGYLNDLDNPDGQRAVSRFERNLRKWERKFAGCLSRNGYRVPPRN